MLTFGVLYGTLHQAAQSPPFTAIRLTHHHLCTTLSSPSSHRSPSIQSLAPLLCSYLATPIVDNTFQQFARDGLLSLNVRAMNSSRYSPNNTFSGGGSVHDRFPSPTGSRTLSAWGPAVQRPSTSNIRGAAFGRGERKGYPKSRRHPGPGSYDVSEAFKRLSEVGKYGSRAGAETAAFVSSGRRSTLLSNAMNYQTIQRGNGETIVSPSYYNIPSMVRVIGFFFLVFMTLSLRTLSIIQ